MYFKINHHDEILHVLTEIGEEAIAAVSNVILDDAGRQLLLAIPPGFKVSIGKAGNKKITTGWWCRVRVNG